MSRWRALFAASTRKRWLAAALGAAVVLSFEPFELVWLAPLAMACLILLWEGATPRQAAWVGFSFGLGLFTAGTYWLYISLNILGGLWPPIALLLMLGLIVVMAGYTALAGFAVVRLTPGSGMARWLLAAPAVWTLTEWLRGWLFTGFPWLSLGYSQVNTPLAGLAPLVGVYGVSCAIVTGAGAFVCLAQGTRAARLLVLLAGGAAVAGVLHLNTIAWTQSTGRELSVTLVQGAVPQELKWTRKQLQPTLELYSRLSAEQGQRDLILWPEAAIPALPFEIPEFLAELNATMRERDTQLLTGILTYDVERGEYRNTLWAMGPEEGMYFKRHLVVFGEFFPLPDFAKRVLRIMNLPSESIVPGPDRQPLLNVKGVPVAATICYEIAFAAEQLQYFPAAQLMVNVSNDAWFGDSIAPHQHLQINQMRAREVGRFMLRATNTGITAVIDPFGRVAKRLPQFESGVINAAVQPHVGTTPYVRLGNQPLILGMIGFLIVAAFAARYRRGPA